MSGKYDANAFSPGDIMRRLRELEQKVRELVSGRRLENASVGSGGIRVHSGGGITVEGGGSINVSDAGDITVDDGGVIRCRYPDGSLAVQVGPNTAAGDDPALASGFGLYVVASPDNGGHDIFRAQEATESGDAYVTIGQPSPSTDGVGIRQFWSKANHTILSASESLFLTSTDSGTTTLKSENASVFIDAGAQLQMFSGDASVWVQAGGGGGTANVELTGAAGTLGLLRRVSSSRRYKQDIEDYETDVDAVLRMRPRTWRSKADVEVDPDTESRHVGFIAEELHELGLHEFVQYDDQDRPEAIAYDRLAAALLQVIQHQQTQIADLYDRIAKLDGGPETPLSPPPVRVDRETKWRKRRKMSTAPAPAQPDDPEVVS